MLANNHTTQKQALSPQILCARLRDALSNAKVTQAELAARMNESRVTVNKWCTGKVMPRPWKWAEIAEILKIDEEELIYGVKTRERIQILLEESDEMSDEELDCLISMIRLLRTKKSNTNVS